MPDQSCGSKCIHSHPLGRLSQSFRGAECPLSSCCLRVYILSPASPPLTQPHSVVNSLRTLTVTAVTPRVVGRLLGGSVVSHSGRSTYISCWKLSAGSRRTSCGAVKSRSSLSRPCCSCRHRSPNNTGLLEDGFPKWKQGCAAQPGFCGCSQRA